MAVERIQDWRRVVVGQRVRVAVAVILSAEGGPSQRVDVRFAVGPYYAGGAGRGRRLGAHGTLLTWADDKRFRQFSFASLADYEISRASKLPAVRVDVGFG